MTVRRIWLCLGEAMPLGVGRSKPDTLAVLVKRSPFLPVPLGGLKAVLAPEVLSLLVVHAPDFNPQQLRDLAVAISAIALRHADHGKPKGIVVLLDGPVLHGAARKAHHLPGPTFEHRAASGRCEGRPGEAGAASGPGVQVAQALL